MDKKTAKTAVLVISILGFVGAGLSILIGIAIFALGGMFIGEEGAALAAAMGWLIALLFIAMGSFQIWVYYSLMKFKNWARILAIITSAVLLLNFPTGTVIGAAMIYFLAFNEDVIKLF